VPVQVKQATSTVNGVFTRTIPRHSVQVSLSLDGLSVVIGTTGHGEITVTETTGTLFYVFIILFFVFFVLLYYLFVLCTSCTNKENNNNNNNM